jgi:hypothetical protein
MNLRKLSFFKRPVAYTILCFAFASSIIGSSELARSVARQVNWPEIAPQAWAGNFERPVELLTPEIAAGESLSLNSREGSASLKMDW